MVFESFKRYAFNTILLCYESSLVIDSGNDEGWTEGTDLFGRIEVRRAMVAQFW